MRIATWNINGIRARFDFIALWLNDRRPDLVGLQELKLETERFPHQEFEKLGYRAEAHGQKSWNGVAILNRIEQATQVERGLAGQEALGSRLISAQYGDMELCTVYCPNGKNLQHPDFLAKLKWYDSLVDKFASRTGGDLVLCGDFNLCPGPGDSWSEELLAGGIFFSDAERRRFEALLATGLHDLYRTVEPNGSQFSWWDYRAGAFHKNQGLRIDFLLGSSRIRERVKSVWVDRDYRKKRDGLTASDHAPVILDLR